jgi:protein associated with RNAse G/E
MQIIKIFNCYGIISCVPNDKVTGGKALKLSDPDMINQNAYQHRVNRIPCYLFFFANWHTKLSVTLRNAGIALYLNLT